ncbi:hypothetical protein ACSS6W_008281 [Trichoderma asperelloides]
MGQIGALYVAQASKIVEDQIDQRALAVGRCSAGDQGSQTNCVSRPDLRTEKQDGRLGVTRGLDTCIQ